MAKNLKGLDNHYGKWRYRFTVKGIRTTVVTDLEATPANRDAAAVLLQDHKMRLVLGLPEPVAAILFSEACDRFEAWKFAKHREKPATARRVQISLASWRSFIGKRTLDEVTAADVVGYMTWRRETDVKEVTLRKDMLAVRQLIRFGNQHNWTAADPTQGIDIPSDRGSLNERVLTDEEERRYLSAADLHPALGDFARVMIQQGMRDSEVLGLRAEHVDLGRGTILISKGKSKASKRTLRMTSEVSLILGRRMALGSRLFPKLVWLGRFKDGDRYRTEQSEQQSYVQILRAHDKACVTAGLDFTPYAFRHTFATRFYDATRNLAALRDVLGHADFRTIWRYVNDNEQRAHEAMKIFEESRTRVRVTVQ